MSKRAEEAQASAILPESIISYAKEHAVLSGLVYREGVKFGYEQAEKDLALTPGDMSIIDEMCTEMRLHTDWPLKGQYAFYEEVLRRFNEQRQK